MAAKTNPWKMMTVSPPCMSGAHDDCQPTLRELGLKFPNDCDCRCHRASGKCDAFFFGLLRVEPMYHMYHERKIRVGWRCWFQNGSHWQLSFEEGWREVWGPPL